MDRYQPASRLAWQSRPDGAALLEPSPVTTPMHVRHAPSAYVALAGAMRSADDLLQTVIERLHRLADQDLDELCPAEASATRDDVLRECAVALEQLRPVLAHERGRAGRMVLALFDARAELARALADRPGARRGAGGEPDRVAA